MTKRNGYAVGANGLILRTANGGVSWSDEESPSRSNLFGVTAYGRNQAVAVGELGTVLITEDAGKTWELQSNITGKALQAIVYRGGSEIWIAGRGGSILKRLEPFSPHKISGGSKLPPVLRSAAGRSSRKPRIPLITITDDGDIPKATPNQ